MKQFAKTMKVKYAKFSKRQHIYLFVFFPQEKKEKRKKNKKLVGLKIGYSSGGS